MNNTDVENQDSRRSSRLRRSRRESRQSSSSTSRHRFNLFSNFSSAHFPQSSSSPSPSSSSSSRWRNFFSFRRRHHNLGHNNNPHVTTDNIHDNSWILYIDNSSPSSSSSPTVERHQSVMLTTTTMPIWTTIPTSHIMQIPNIFTFNSVNQHQNNNNNAINHQLQIQAHRQQVDIILDSLPEIHSKDDDTCPICLESLFLPTTTTETEDYVVQTKCNHNIHFHCLRAWLIKDVALTCPICRLSLLST